jgi:hypothetical protein
MRVLKKAPIQEKNSRQAPKTQSKKQGEDRELQKIQEN